MRAFHAPAAFRLRGRSLYWHFVDVVWLFLFLAIYVWVGWGAEYHG
jgi:cytochrome c oxidase subunit 3